MLVAAALGSVAAAAVGIARGHRVGRIVGVGVSAVTWVLYVVQETVGLPGLSRDWWEPTRLLALVLSGLFVVLAIHPLCRSDQ
jgi:hypothetical protein